MPPETAPTSVGEMSSQAPRLKRVLGLWDLIVYGMIIIQVVAPVPIFGIVQQRSNGHAVTAVLLAMVAMLITAVSYGRMAVLYPMAGSAYTYVARAMNPHLGFLTGWAMFLDYLIIPLVGAIIPALAIKALVPAIPYALLTFLIILAMTVLNLRGIRTTARTNTLLLVVTSVVVVVFVILAVRHLFAHDGWRGVFSIKPFYDPSKFKWNALLSGTSLAALTYIGFDSVTTLAEDAINPKRNIVLATVLVCLITGALSALELYLFQRVWPDWTTSSDLDTAYLDVMKLVGGTVLFVLFSIVMSVSQFGSGLTGQVGAARLIYGMGRDNVLPRSLFGYLNPRSQNPTRNILLIGALAFVGTLAISFEDACDLLNFGAFLGFMGVNAATVKSYYLNPPESHRRSFLKDALLPGAGFIFCLIIWIGLPMLAKIVGTIWLLGGLAYCAIRTRGFREQPLLFDFHES